MHFELYLRFKLETSLKSGEEVTFPKKVDGDGKSRNLFSFDVTYHKIILNILQIAPEENQRKRVNTKNRILNSHIK